MEVNKNRECAELGNAEISVVLYLLTIILLKKILFQNVYSVKNQF